MEPVTRMCDEFWKVWEKRVKGEVLKKRLFFEHGVGGNDSVLSNDDMKEIRPATHSAIFRIGLTHTAPGIDQCFVFLAAGGAYVDAWEQIFHMTIYVVTPYKSNRRYRPPSLEKKTLRLRLRVTSKRRCFASLSVTSSRRCA